MGKRPGGGPQRRDGNLSKTRVEKTEGGTGADRMRKGGPPTPCPHGLPGQKRVLIAERGPGSTLADRQAGVAPLHWLTLECPSDALQEAVMRLDRAGGISGMVECARVQKSPNLSRATAGLHRTPKKGLYRATPPGWGQRKGNLFLPQMPTPTGCRADQGGGQGEPRPESGHSA